MHYIVGSYDHVVGLGMACPASVPMIYESGPNGPDYKKIVEPDVAKSDIINFVNLRKEVVPTEGSIFRLTPAHGFVDRVGETFYYQAKLDESSRFVDRMCYAGSI